MIYREGSESEIVDIEEFVRAAIYPAYYHPDLIADQRDENERIIKISRESCLSAIKAEQKLFLVALDKTRLCGFVLVERFSCEFAELDWLVVSHEYQGKGVANQLVEIGIAWLGEGVTIKLGVIHFNERAIKFYKKLGFNETGEIAGSHKIPRILMIRNPEPT
jgi:ribosomal protein S18 acetylase RimI-like enzyme